ncbi:hypothetical protein PVK06_010857 [Gossypium arboreum]|uniref:Uncharacterized protein n=1 Tax=Gossypium arboreum TaxID=29729 RepID=A0ABR0Q7G5_GOSAR|nr:hypothetical protein PVK06_010857 [Gossypium arboreum]
MRWLKDNFQTIEASVSDVENNQFAHAFILRLIRGLLMPDKYRNLIHLRWNNSARHSSTPTELEDIRRDLDQETEKKIQGFKNASRSNFGQSQHLALQSAIGHFVMIKIHKFDRVMRQFKCTQRIPPPPQELDGLHKIDLRGRLEGN